MRYNSHPKLVKAKNPRRAIDMIQQEKITARSGLALFAEFFKAMGVEELVDRSMPGPCSGRGFKPSRYIKPLCMSMYGGGESIEEMREIREDESLREAVELEETPSSSATGDWLRRQSDRGHKEGKRCDNARGIRQG
jgi:hypothetical protein